MDTVTPAGAAVIHSVTEASAPAVTLDVRGILPRNRHPLIFGIFSSLPVGEALLLTNDHDPKPLFYQMQAEEGGQFSWDYVEKGPDRWQVRIGRTGAAPARVVQECCGALG